MMAAKEEVDAGVPPIGGAGGVEHHHLADLIFGLRVGRTLK